MNANTTEKKTHRPLVRIIRALGHPVIGWLLLACLGTIVVVFMNLNEMLMEENLKYMQLRNEFDRNLLESQHQIREELMNIHNSLSGTEGSQ